MGPIRATLGTIVGGHLKGPGEAPSPPRLDAFLRLAGLGPAWTVWGTSWHDLGSHSGTSGTTLGPSSHGLQKAAQRRPRAAHGVVQGLPRSRPGRPKASTGIAERPFAYVLVSRSAQSLVNSTSKLPWKSVSQGANGGFPRTFHEHETKS